MAKTYSNYTIDRTGQLYSKKGMMSRLARSKLTHEDSTSASVVVAEVMSNIFFGGVRVEHKDGDKNNNHIDNLIPTDKPKKIIPLRSVKQGRKVYHINFEKDTVDKYTNISDASLKCDIAQRTLHTWATNSQHGWYFEGNEPPEKLNLPAKEKNTKIVWKNVDNMEVIAKFDSIREAERDERITVKRCTIMDAIKEARPLIINGVKTVFERDDGVPVKYKDTFTKTVTSKGVLKIDKNGNETFFKSQNEAANDIFKSNAFISDLVNGEKQYNDFTYKSSGKQKFDTEVERKVKISSNKYEEIELDDEMKSCEEYINDINESEEFVPLKDYEKYKISKSGKIINSKKEEMTYSNEVYSRVTIAGQKLRVHILVAKQFIENPYPTTFTVVNHKNGDKKDNRACNLEWCTPSENNLHARQILKCKTRGRAVIKKDKDGNETVFDTLIKAAADAGITPNYLKIKYIEPAIEYKGAFWSFRDTYDTKVEEDDEYKILSEYPNYRIYKSGKIWSIYFERFLTPTSHNGYMDVSVVNKNGVNSTVKVHQLVAKAFLSKNNDQNQVNHIDNNPLNNNADNLEWCTAKENVQHALNFGRKNKEQVPVYKRDKLSGKILERYESMTKAANACGTTKSQISKACMARRELIGFYWDTEENKKTPLDIKTTSMSKQKCTEVIQTMDNGTKITYVSQNAAAKAMGCEYISIYNACKNGTKFNNSFWETGETKEVIIVRKLNSNKKIIRVDEVGKEKRFDSIADCAKSIDPERVKNISANINAAIKNNKKMYGYFWKREELNT